MTWSVFLKTYTTDSMGGEQNTQYHAVKDACYLTRKEAEERAEKEEQTTTLPSWSDYRYIVLDAPETL